jgi:hypothetical protein
VKINAGGVDVDVVKRVTKIMQVRGSYGWAGWRCRREVNGWRYPAAVVKHARQKAK